MLLSLAIAARLGAARATEHEAVPGGYPGLVPGLAVQHHTITTSSAEAQRFFDQGLTLVYAFNHDEAVRAFRRAAALDPRAVMPHWGMALALGPNINLDVDPEHERAAHEAVEHATTLARHAPRHEQDYVAALAKRYSTDPHADLQQLAQEYSAAMGELTRRYPDDLDAATLYAESLMDLRPWRLWTADGTPAEGTETIVAVLESVLRRDPQHVGANHYYIHAVEASPHPERAYASAKRLETLVPMAGHLVHMPAHIYVRTGDYDAAARSNEAAVRVDRAYMEATGVQGVYPLMYYSHNVQFLSAARAMEGRLADARRAADELVTLAAPMVAAMPMIEFALSQTVFVELRFARWAEALRLPAPDASLPLTTALWSFARGVSCAATGRVSQAEAERSAFAATRAKVPAGAVFGGTGLNSAASVLDLAALVLDARIASARGDRKTAVEKLRQAALAEDRLGYEEPPVWVAPVRESLGAALLLDRRPAEAEEVFRADLERNPRNGRSLFGLLHSLEAEGRAADADLVRAQFETAWRNADVQLRLEDL